MLGEGQGCWSRSGRGQGPGSKGEGSGCWSRSGSRLGSGEGQGKGGQGRGIVGGSRGWSQGGAVGFSGERFEMKRKCSDRIPFHSIPFQSIPFHSIPSQSIPFHSIPIHSIPFHSMFYPMPFNMGTKFRDTEYEVPSPQDPHVFL